MSNTSSQYFIRGCMLYEEHRVKVKSYHLPLAFTMSFLFLTVQDSWTCYLEESPCTRH